MGCSWTAKIDALARRLIEAAAERSEAAPTLAVEFAETVGAALEPANRLVIGVLAGGPFAVRRALELAEVVLGLDRELGADQEQVAVDERTDIPARP